MNNKTEVKFFCYKYRAEEGECTLFQFFPVGRWDGDKLTIEEALKNYPIYKYEWINYE